MVIINVLDLIKIFINILVRYHCILNSIIIDKSLLFLLKFWLLLYYFFNFKQKFSITFYFQINSQIKRQNSIIKAYF